MTTKIIENKKSWQIKRLNTIKIITSCCLLVVGFIGYGVYWAFFDMIRLPKGTYLTEKKSPNGDYTLIAYVTSGGATTDFAIRGELVFNKEKKTKNIYWNVHESNADIEWIDKDTVEINSHILNVPHEKFDFRND